jgi:3-oxoacyl-[acyl-carrier-protein] synthase-1
VIGHTLGAAGAVEAVVGLLAMGHGFLPGTCGLRVPDRDAPSGLVADPETGVSLSYVLCNAFGFGGSNASVLLGASP